MPEKNPGLTMADADALLRAQKLRRTLSRVHVLMSVARFGRPASHSQVASELAEHGFDESTIFRCLKDLTAAGILKKTDLGDRVWRFQIREHSDDPLAASSLIVCTDCGATSHVDATQAILGIRRRVLSDWQLDELVLRGRCPACLHESQ